MPGTQDKTEQQELSGVIAGIDKQGAWRPVGELIDDTETHTDKSDTNEEPGSDRFREHRIGAQ